MSTGEGTTPCLEDLLIREFPKANYGNLIEINLHDNEEVHEAFESNLDVDEDSIKDLLKSRNRG